MNRDPVRGESADETSVLRPPSPYLSGGSTYSEDSYANRDEPIDSNSSDYAEVGSDYESCLVPIEERIAKAVQTFVQSVANRATTADTIADASEENNNDPNNNTDSIEKASLEVTRAARRTVSPRPGCNKDSFPLLTAGEIILETIRKQIDQVLGLVSSITPDSVLAAIMKNPHVAMADFTLSDLVTSKDTSTKPVAESLKRSAPRATGAAIVDHSKGAIPKVQTKSAERSWDKEDQVDKNACPTDQSLHVNASANVLMTKDVTEGEVVCMEIYNKLKTMFPNVDPNILKIFCPSELGPGDKATQFNSIVDNVLENIANLPPPPVIHDRDNEEAANGPGLAHGNVDKVYEDCLVLFPNADPLYLRDYAREIASDPDAIEDFIETNLETANYPTREQYMARLKITDQQRQYTTGFNVKQYLTVIPDPFKHFLTAERKCEHSTVALEFLKNHFKEIDAETISSTYTQLSYNLSMTAESLELAVAEMRSKRGRMEIPTDDILLLQEIAFVKHKAEISEYIASVRRAEETEFQIMKERNLLIECQCCGDPECVPFKCSTCDIGHLFCNNCIVKGTEVKIGEGETRINCFADCDSEISLSVLERVLPPTTFSIFSAQRQNAEVVAAGIEGLVSCPFCNFSSIPPKEDKIFKCLNPECMKESCRLCKELSHVPFKCHAGRRADEGRIVIEEKMTKALTRTCPNCSRVFFKEDGCNQIICHCGAKMCYVCDQLIRDYTHFRGQGSNDVNLCPLYTDDKIMNAVAVRKVGEEAKKQVMELNPDLKIDTTGLLPDLPQPTQGPHTYIDNADELPLHARRILDLP